MLDDILSQVQKPGRYIGNEWNVSRKPFEKAYIKFALCFPDLYEVGMSNLGIRILYSYLNNIEDVSCERFFSPDLDLQDLLKKMSEELFSLESRKRLGEFDIIGFSLGSELGYTNILNILESGNIPLKAAARDHTHPLVIGGGPCALNPEPLHEFFDLFVIGEAEELIVEFINTYRQHKQKFKSGNLSKQDLLFYFSSPSGVYVPSFYETTYASSGELLEFKPRFKGLPVEIKKRTVRDLNQANFPSDWLLPYIQIVHDRITLEIMRGCPNRCRFCQARSGYFPLRFRNAKNILDIASLAYKQTGYEELSLAGLSVSDYPRVEELIGALYDLFKEKKVSLSLPSIKANALIGAISSLIAGIKKTGLTFAPEAGTERLRNILAKDFDEKGFFKTLEEAYLSGYRRVKLYFMVGLPYEEDRDLDEIINFAIRASDLKRRIKGGPAEVNLSINTFIPKPHTPFQWFGMEGLEGMVHKHNYLKKRLGKSRILLNFHSPYMSFLEGVLCRGDRKICEVIFRAFKSGAKFDAWSNHFNFEKWMEAFRACNIDPVFYLKQKTIDKPLPWDFIDVGITKEELISEFNKVIDIKEDERYNLKVT